GNGEGAGGIGGAGEWGGGLTTIPRVLQVCVQQATESRIIRLSTGSATRPRAGTSGGGGPPPEVRSSQDRPRRVGVALVPALRVAGLARGLTDGVRPDHQT